MGDWYETVVDVDAEAEEAKASFIADAVVSELVRMRIVHIELTDCTLGSPGRRPDTGINNILRKKDGLLYQLATNGLEISVGRSVAVPINVDSISCPNCKYLHNDTINPLPWGEAVGDWYDGGKGELLCPACLVWSSVVSWRHCPNAAFGYLSFTFWNWPPFDQANWLTLPAKIIEQVTGHHCEIVSGKL